MKSLATCQNVAIKIGGFAMVRRAWTPAEVVPVIRQTIEIFGPHRCMFGSNYPVERGSHTMETLRATWEEAIQAFSSDEQADLRTGSAKHWYRPRQQHVGQD
jgi:predicted TIM-barrel fold metal-dependent hydrolase